MSSTATASVEVGCDPKTAFDAFTAEIGTWWKRGTQYWNDAERATALRFEPFVGGRLTEVYDPATGTGFDIGQVLVWEPGQRLVFTWRQGNWGPGEATEVVVTFEPVDGATRVTVKHGGWENVPSAVPQLRDGYSHGWAELLGFYAEHAGRR